MATDAALLAGVRAGAGPVLRLYRWSPACLSFGRNQSARGIYDASRARAQGFDVVRRPTGGLAVLHDREITYAVSAPVDVFGSLRRAYITINRALVAGLRRLGVPAQLSTGATGPTRLAAASRMPCFDAPAIGEVMARGRKLVGSAQRREGRALLQHGSILVEGEQSRVAGLLKVPPSAPPAPHATLAELLGHVPDDAEVAAAIVAGFGDCGIRLAAATLSRDERACVRALLPTFQDDAWTWRR